MSLNQSYSGSQNSAQSVSNSATYGTEATGAARLNAETANSIAMNNWREAADYNSREAAKQRQWLENMANTVYQRTVKDMKTAGINPILAAQMGLGTASIGSGATASMSNPQTFNASAYPDSRSSSMSNSNGSSWSEGGIVTAIEKIGELLIGALNGATNSTTINNIMNAASGYHEGTKEQAKAVTNPDTKMFTESNEKGETRQFYFNDKNQKVYPYGTSYHDPNSWYWNGWKWERKQYLNLYNSIFN
jgi:hypothetical protein